MTALPSQTQKKLGLVIDLDICVGCHACAVNCKARQSGAHVAPATPHDPSGPDASSALITALHGC